MKKLLGIVAIFLLIAGCSKKVDQAIEKCADFQTVMGSKTFLKAEFKKTLNNPEYAEIIKLINDQKRIQDETNAKFPTEMKKWKHSFCVPIDKGWATAKYLEYLKCGISPFMHPEYDDQKNTNIQNFYRVQSVEEIKDKIDMNDNIHTEEINKGIKNCLSDEYVSGQKINDDIYESLVLKRNIKNKLRDLWTSQAVGSLDGFMD